jgi:dihydroxyacetone kinase-like protein
LDAATLAACFKAGVDGVMQRGKAVAEDKTMVDALLPASAALERDLASGATLAEMLHNAAEAAEMGMMATISMQARKGRASYLGPRSVDHQDPGATSAFLLLLAAEDVWRSK